MPLEPDERNEVILLIENHDRDVVLPRHKENLSAYATLAAEVRRLSDLVVTYFAKQTGIDEERERMAKHRDREISEANLNAAQSNKYSQWSLFGIGFVTLLLMGISVYIGVKAYQASQAPHPVPAPLVGHDPDIPRQ